MLVRGAGRVVGQADAGLGWRCSEVWALRCLLLTWQRHAGTANTDPLCETEPHLGGD